MTAAASADSIVITGCGWVTPFAHGNAAAVVAAAERAAPPPADARFWAVPDTFLAEFPHLTEEIRAEKGAWLAAIAIEHACREAGIVPANLDPTRIGMVLGCALAGQIGMIDFANEVREQSARFVSPIHFPQTVGNYIAGALARGYNIRGSNLTIAGGPLSGLDAVLEAASLLRRGGIDVVFAGGVECLTDPIVEGMDPGDAPPSEGACLFVLERESDAKQRGAKRSAQVDDQLAAAAAECAAPPSADHDAPIHRWITQAGAAGSAAACAIVIERQ